MIRADWQVRSVEAEHDWGQCAGWETAQVGHRKIRDATYCRCRIGTGLEVNFDQADAAHRARLDVADVAPQGEETFITVSDVGFDLFRWHARVESCDNHHRNLHGGEEINGHIHDGSYAYDDHDHARHQDKKRVLNSEEGHAYLPPFWFAL